MKLAPIVIFCFDRPNHLEKLLISLKSNEEFKESEIYIFQDGFKEDRNFDHWQKVTQVVENGLKGFNYELIINPTNLGCDPNVVQGINYVFEKHDKIIVLEDDLEVSSKFLAYMNFGLNFFENESNVGCINAFNLKTNISSDYFFIKGGNPWGWGTWKRAWSLINFNSEELLKQINNYNDFNYGLTIDILKNTNAWDVRWYASLYINNKLGLFPKISYVYQNGFEGSGTHNHPKTIIEKLFTIDQLNQEVNEDFIKSLPIKEDALIKKKHKHVFFKINRIPFTFKEKISAKYYLFKHFVKTKIFRLA